MLKKIPILVLLGLSNLVFAQNQGTSLDEWPEFKEVPYASKKVSGHDFTIVLKDLPDTQVFWATTIPIKSILKTLPKPMNTEWPDLLVLKIGKEVCT